VNPERSALDLMVRGGQRSTSFDLFDIEEVLELADRTRRSLELAGLWIDTPPSALPGVDEICNRSPIERSGQNVRIDIIGPPGALKTTLWYFLGNAIDGSVLVEEPFGKMVDELGLPAVRQMNLSNRRLNSLAYADNLLAESEPGHIYICDRSVRDEGIWLKADFLTGNIDSFTYLAGSQLLGYFLSEEERTSGKERADIEIIAIPSVEKSLERKGVGGRVRTTEYLKILYTQYLAYVVEARQSGVRNLIVADMEADTYDKSVYKVWELVESCLQ